MKQWPGKNVAASVRQRLLNRARRDERPFNELLQYYAMERFLYRLSRSAHSDRFVLKGALMLRVWRSPIARATMDIDMLGRTSNREAELIAGIREVLGVEVEPDGLTFDASGVTAERITKDADYEGVRLRIRGALDTARITLQIDVGFGDPVYPEAKVAELPGLLDFPAPRLLCYSRESAIAEKFEAMIKLGEVNTRMKDFYDVWLLSRQFDFTGADLAEAILLTFTQRRTEVPATIAAFSPAFGSAKQHQWQAFCRRLQQEHVPQHLTEVVADLAAFLAPIIAALRSDDPPPEVWMAPGPWRRRP